MAKAPTPKEPKKPKLTQEEQHFLIVRLACYTQIKDVQTEFEEQFGRPIDRNVVGKYDPTRRYSTFLSQRLTDLFHTTRENYEKGLLAMHPISKRVYRVDKLGKMFETAYGKGNHPLAASLLKQAAEEVGEIDDRKAKAGRYGMKDRLPPGREDEPEEFDGSAVEMENMKQVLAEVFGGLLQAAPSTAKH